MTVKGVLMAGGKGTRLRPITYSIPKPLVPVAGKPVISYILDSFYNAGVKDIIITTGYKFEALIKGVLENKFSDQNILFSVEKDPAGTAGGVKLAENFIDDTFVVGSGDILIDFDVSKMIEEHKKRGANITIALTRVDDPSQFGIAEVDDEGYVKRFLEKPKKSETFSNTINAGVYVIEPSVLEYIPKGVQFDFAKDLFPKAMANGIKIYTYEINGVWLDAGRPGDLIKANQIMVDKYGDRNINGSRMILKARIPDGVNVSGPTYIGEGVAIGKGSSIDSSTIYEGVQIGNDVEIKNSVIMSSCRILDGSKISDSVIMQNTVIGEACEIRNSVLSQKLNLQKGSRVFDVALSSEIIQDEN
ncbi:mannose-1-phosphate guanyltransferase [Thermoplasma volcanium GSS1]|uniref:Mannose-1-phosphate guanyltransferase n=1 Tax=Thermoplasma volcanium (strain ATCC 51530 / DSM 4299 / JCM 9571 / NBRC 15438 / GSS1) TaxID=273116 RepID=Q97CM1_THEVO|nr:NDP-sugar synthase [Thermoplasma volcanium]BAB59222.1 mannose-1-phosphate guanyltransferase [Thermoplasma volcanium GSS1]